MVAVALRCRMGVLILDENDDNVIMIMMTMTIDDCMLL